MEINKQEQRLHAVKQYLAHFKKYYPGILEWFPRVQNELASGKRSMFIASDGSDILGLAITKNSPNAKLCHISVATPARHYGLGQTLMQYALRDMALRGAVEISVTTSEKIFRKHAHFFSAAGFEAVDWHVNRYRQNVSEVVWRKNIISNAFQPHLSQLHTSWNGTLLPLPSSAHGISW